MTQVTADFEAGTNGNTIATSDPGSATAFDLVTIGTAASAIYDTTHVANGSLAAKLATGASSVQVVLGWSTAFGTVSTTYYCRFYRYMTALPGSTRILATGLNSGSTGWRLQLRSDGKIELTDKGPTVQATSTTALATNQWVRVEFKIVPGTGATGTVECKIFNTATSSTPDETFSASSIDILSSHNDIRFGQITASTNYTSWWDNLVAGAASYPGPVSSAPVNTVAPAVTGTTAVGDTLSCTTGTWTGDVSSGYAYQWKDGAGNIAGATSSTYVIGSGEATKNIHCTVTATGTGGSTSADSNTVGPVGTSTGTLAGILPMQELFVIEGAGGTSVRGDELELFLLLQLLN